MLDKNCPTTPWGDSGTAKKNIYITLDDPTEEAMAQTTSVKLISGAFGNNAP